MVCANRAVARPPLAMTVLSRCDEQWVTRVRVLLGDVMASMVSPQLRNLALKRLLDVRLSRLVGQRLLRVVKVLVLVQIAMWVVVSGV